MKTQLYLAFVSMLLLSAACSSSQQEGSNSNYADEIRQWHQERIESLKKEDGWLNLIGLFWLREGSNSLGADNSNDIILPKEKAAPALGTLTLENGKVRFKQPLQLPLPPMVCVLRIHSFSAKTRRSPLYWLMVHCAGSLLSEATDMACVCAI